MSELNFLAALHVDLQRHDRINAAGAPHELFQTSTIQALLGGAFDGDVTLNELLGHGDLGLGTLNGLDGELIVIDGEVFKAELDCTLSRPDPQSLTPYAVVVPFTPGPVQTISGPIDEAALEQQLWDGTERPRAPTAIRIDGDFEMVRVRSVPKQVPPYGLLADAIDHQHNVSCATSRERWSDSAFPTAWRESRSSASTCTSPATGGWTVATSWTTR